MCSVGLPFDESLYKSEHSIEDAEIQVFAGFHTKSLLSILTYAEVAENFRQPQGSQEEEEGSGKGNFAMSKNTSRL